MRLYEQRGLIAPARTAAGWRVYGPDEMTRVAEITALREFGLCLTQVAASWKATLKVLNRHLLRIRQGSKVAFNKS